MMIVDEMKRNAKIGRAATVADEMFNRGGETGTIVDVFEDGVSLVFSYSDRVEPEHWKWQELQWVDAGINDI